MHSKLLLMWPLRPILTAALIFLLALSKLLDRKPFEKHLSVTNVMTKISTELKNKFKKILRFSLK